MSSSGTAMVTVGIILLAVAVFFGYLVYTGTSTESESTLISEIRNVSSASGNSVSGTAGFAVDLSPIFIESTFLIVKILVLMLFANVGYKFVSLGLQENREAAREESEKTQVPKKRSTD